MDTLRALCERFTNCHPDALGNPDTVRVAHVGFEDPDAAGNSATGGPFVLVLVEPRLLAQIPGSPISSADLGSRLPRWKDDLAADGCASRFLAFEMNSRHGVLNGRLVLSMRDFIKSVRDEACPSLEQT